MLANSQTLNQLFSQAKQLSPENRLRLVQRIIQTLVPHPPVHNQQMLRFGEFGGEQISMSTLKDFTIAEWQPSNEELDGS